MDKESSKTLQTAERWGNSNAASDIAADAQDWAPSC